MTSVMNQRRTRPTPTELVHELADVAADIPRFAAAPLHRHRHQRWGATDAELASAMPGGVLVPGAQFRATRAVTIAAAPDEVWPWLVHVGCLRAGFYADDLLDNLGHPSARTILPEFQGLETGQARGSLRCPSPSSVTSP